MRSSVVGCLHGCCTCTSSDRRAIQPFIRAMWDVNLASVKAALETEASPNRSLEPSCPPIVAATVGDDEGMVNALLEKGADPDMPITVDVPFLSPGVDYETSIIGERALHIAARTGKVEIVRLLLQRSHADPNATDNQGCTPLTRTCNYDHVCMEVVRLLLEAGADPTLAAENGYTPLHVAAQTGHIDLVDMLYTSAPGMLNHCTDDGGTPLYAACIEGRESMVRRLLSLGAMQSVPTTQDGTCPLLVAAHQGFVGVVRILINEGGIRAVGGEEQLLTALITAVRRRQARILRLLLMVDGEEKKRANTSLEEGYLLHYGAAYCYPAGVSILLELGADEALRDAKGRIPRNVIGLYLGSDGGPQVDRVEELVIRQMLQRGPAYRARSWAWPSDEEAAVGGSYGFATAVATGASLPSPPPFKTPPAFDLRIYRAKQKNNSELFVRVVGRYCAGD